MIEGGGVPSTVLYTHQHTGKTDSKLHTVWIRMIFACVHFQNVSIFRVWVQGTSVHTIRIVPQTHSFTCKAICLLVPPSGSSMQVFSPWLLGRVNARLGAIDLYHGAAILSFSILPNRGWKNKIVWFLFAKWLLACIICYSPQGTCKMEAAWGLFLNGSAK